MLVRLDAAQSLEHLETGDREPVALRRRTGDNRAPHGMGVKHSTGIPAPDDLDVQQRLGRRFADGVDRQSKLVHGENVGVLELSLVDRAGGDRQPERIAAHDRAEIAACAEYPASVVEPTTDGGEGDRDRVHSRETSWRSWR